MSHNKMTWDGEDPPHEKPHYNPHHKTHYEIIIMKISELLAVNESIKGQLNKAEAEIIAKISTLQDAIVALTDQLANLNLPDEVVQSLTDLQAASQSLDDVVADETPVEDPAA